MSSQNYEDSQPSTVAGVADDTTPLTKDYDDDHYSYHSDHDSLELSRKPLGSFDTRTSISYPDDTENGFLTKNPKGKVSSRWWRVMLVRARRRRKQGHKRPGDMKDLKDSYRGGIFVDLLQRTVRRQRRSWYHYCIFGGIGGLGILAILLTINLSLGIATLIWSSYDFESVLQNWGRPGTGTEDLAWYPTDFTRDILPKRCHSHNDYWRRVPLFSALRSGCIGVEADVWLFDNELYVGHNTASLTRNRTFTSLYVNPLLDILEHQNSKSAFYNGNASHGVFDTDPDQTLTLLIDLKTGGMDTWPMVLSQLEPLRARGWLSFVEDRTLHTRPITVVGTGNTRFDVLTRNESYRDAFFDSPLDLMYEAPAASDSTQSLPSAAFATVQETSDDPLAGPVQVMGVGQGHEGISPDTSFSPLNSYYASVSLKKAVGRLWRGKLSDKQIEVIRGQIRGAHRRGLKVRYWGTPSWPLGLRNHVWDVLMKEGADVLDVDDLRAATRLAW